MNHMKPYISYNVWYGLGSRHTQKVFQETARASRPVVLFLAPRVSVGHSPVALIEPWARMLTCGCHALFETGFQVRVCTP